MKKLSKIVLTVGLLGSAIAANAEDLSTNVTATATIEAPAELTAEYTPGAPITTDNLVSQDFGSITLSGYKGTPTIENLSFSDAGGVAKRLSLKDASGNTLFANVIYKNTMLKVNAGTMSGSNDPLPEGQGVVTLRTIGSQGTIPAGQYTDSVSITLTNQ